MQKHDNATGPNSIQILMKRLQCLTVGFSASFYFSRHEIVELIPTISGFHSPITSIVYHCGENDELDLLTKSQSWGLIGIPKSSNIIDSFPVAISCLQSLSPSYQGEGCCRITKLHQSPLTNVTSLEIRGSAKSVVDAPMVTNGFGVPQSVISQQCLIRGFEPVDQLRSRGQLRDIEPAIVACQQPSLFTHETNPDTPTNSLDFSLEGARNYLQRQEGKFELILSERL